MFCCLYGFQQLLKFKSHQLVNSLLLNPHSKILNYTIIDDRTLEILKNGQIKHGNVSTAPAPFPAPYTAPALRGLFLTQKFITLFIAKYNIKQRVLNYINAGHNPPLLYHNNAKTDNVTYLETGCTGLGMLDELPKVDEGIINIEPNSTLLCYTDGVVELENNKGQEYGLESLEELLKSGEYKSMDSLNNLIREKLIKHKENQPYIDDIALFSCKFF